MEIRTSGYAIKQARLVDELGINLSLREWQSSLVVANFKVNKIHFISKCIENTIDMINNSEQNIEEKLEEDISKSQNDIHEKAKILYHNLSKHAYTKVRVIDDKTIEFCIA